MASYRIGILKGDDIGLEVVPVAVQVIRAAKEIHLAVERVVAELEAVTPDLGDKGSTSGMGDAICEAVGQM